MEEEAHYRVQITSKAEEYYYDVLSYFYKYHSEESADKKSKALLDLAISLEQNPFIGKEEEGLESLGYNHRYILYFYTRVKAIKIIYFIDEKMKTVFVTDFFPCESDENKMGKR